MKKLVSVLLCLSVCITISALYPGHATCEDTLKICNCETGVLNLEISSSVSRNDCNVG